MVYSAILASKIRTRLGKIAKVEEKEMMGGLTFILNAKMCVGIIWNEMMCRIDPIFQDEAVNKRGWRIINFTGRHMNGYIMVNSDGMKSEVDFEY